MGVGRGGNLNQFHEHQAVMENIIKQYTPRCSGISANSSHGYSRIEIDIAENAFVQLVIDFLQLFLREHRTYLAALQCGDLLNIKRRI